MSEKIVLKGRLHFLGWFISPWKLTTEDGQEIDFWPKIEDVLKSLNGKGADQYRNKDSYILVANKSAVFKLEYKPGESLALVKKNSFAFSNVQAYIEESLIWLSGRLVKVELENHRLSISADPSENVLGVYFTGEGNSCKIPAGAEETVCKIGQGKETCIFTAVSGGGFLCEKFSGPTARMLLSRFAAGTMNAGRIGNCTVLGRKD